jgi:hypothetical protein
MIYLDYNFWPTIWNKLWCLGQGYGTNCGTIGEYFECNSLSASWVCVAPHHCLSRTKNFNHHFLPKVFKELRYLLWFVLINLIGCDASQIICFLIFFLQGHFDWPITKDNLETFQLVPHPSHPSPKKVGTCFLHDIL